MGDAGSQRIERNRQVVLKARPQGMVTEACFEVVDAPPPEIPPDGAIVAVRYAGVDPTIRGWLDERGNYMAGVEIGGVIRSSGVGEIVATNDPERYPVGKLLSVMTGWQEYCTVAPDDVLPVSDVAEGIEPVEVLHVLGHIGMTAYVGVLQVAKPQPGETFLVSAAGGGVGATAGQIAKLQGARVIGIAGTDAKCEWVVDELGFEGCINYKTEDVSARLKELAPQGVDIFFDNVGGELLDTVLRRIAVHGRVVLCGDISTYNTDVPPPPLYNVKYLMGRRARMEGFNSLDHWEHYQEAAQQLLKWVRNGDVKYLLHEFDGLEHGPEALVRLFNGDHLGKLVIHVS